VEQALNRLRSFAARPHQAPCLLPNRPKHTVRLRLTILYGGMFLVAGAALLAICYALVVRGTDASSGAAQVSALTTSGNANLADSSGTTAAAEALGLTGSQKNAFVVEMVAVARAQTGDVLHQFLIQSTLALAIMAVLSIVFGWIAAGWILRPVRTIIKTTRQISAASLDERLSLSGPDDEIKELGDTIDALLARLEASFQAQRQFIANASHELRSPLARQRVLSQVALADPEATVDSLKQAHERVIASGDQQNRLIEAMLALARGQAGLSTRAPFDLAELVDTALASRSEEAGRLGLILETNLSPAPVDGSAQLAERLVANLIDNAVRHNVRGGRITVNTETRRGRAGLTITNTGPLIPAADVARLTQPFQRLGASRMAHPRPRSGIGHATTDGLGLGLAIVEAVANAHSAALKITPRLDGGLIVHVRFPGT
jgi:signal transduction histidine kinase